MSDQFMARTLRAIAIGMVAASLGCGDSAPTRPTESTTLKVLSVSPSTGAIAAETALRIAGTGFKSGATVTIGDVKVSSTLVGSTALNAVAPPHASGPMDVTVTNPDGQSSTLVEGFTYVAPLASLIIGGNTALTSVGETSQLSVTAGYADGTTREVTSEARWYVANTTVVTMSPTGVVSATALGATTVSAQFPRSQPYLVRSVVVSVTPPGTFAAAGRVREPGAGDLNGVEVRNAASGQTVLAASGQFSLGGLTNGHLSFTKDGYESTALDAVPGVIADVPMQRVVRIEAGSAPVSSKLAPNDLEYRVTADAYCQPCRLIRITSPTPGSIRVTLTWTGTAAPLRVWAGGRVVSTDTGPREVVADVPIAGGEAVVFVGCERAGAPGDYIPITINVTVGG